MDDLKALERQEDADLEELQRSFDKKSSSKYQQPDIKVSVSDFVEKLVCWDYGKRMSFKWRPWLPQIYDSEYLLTQEDIFGNRSPVRRTLLKTSRQTEKSTSLGNKIISNCFMNPNLSAIFVSSAGLNMSEFSEQRIENPLRVSPGLSAWSKKAIVDNKMTKRWPNYSRLVLRSAFLDASRVRGIPGDLIAVDEIQDSLPENLPVIFACGNNSTIQYGPMYMLAGTPLSFDNQIELIWSKNSSQGVWMTRCSRCRHWNPPYPQQVGKYGMICEKCSKALNPLTDGQWVRGRTNLENVAYAGYHLSRPLMAYTVAYDRQLFRNRWNNLLKDVNDPNVTDAAKMNEHFGLSYDSGKKPITRAQLMACCHPGLAMRRILPDPIRMDPTRFKFLGIDWGEGSEDGAYTVVAMGYMNGEVLEVAYVHRYTGAEADENFVRKDLADLIETNGINLAFCDAGHGWGIIGGIREMIRGGMERLVPLQYVPSSSRVVYYDEEAHQFRAHRTRWMAKVFDIMKRGQRSGGIRLPRWAEFEDPYALDVLNIFADKSPRLKQTIYSHTGTDDTFHALLNLVTAKLFAYGELAEFVNA